LRRRAFVRAGVVTTAGLVVGPSLVGCADRDPATTRSASASTSAATGDDADVALLTDAITEESRLLSLAVATLQAHRDLAKVVQPVVTSQRAHVRRLQSSLTEPPEVHRGRPPVVRGSRKGAVAALRDQVSAAEQSRREDCLAATSGLLARLHASVSASHATTVETLRSVR
jgi:hypothetical protein